MNKKLKGIIGSVFVIGIIAVLMGTATQSYFFDVERSEGNTIQAGTIDLLVNGQNGDAVTEVVTITDMKPCMDFYVLKKLTVTGNPADVWLHIEEPTCGPGETTEPELEENPANDKHDIHNYITYDLWIDNDKSGDVSTGDDPIIHPDDHIKLGDIWCCWLYLGQSTPDVEIWIIQSFHMQAEVTNWAQGDICMFDEEFRANQLNAPDPTSHRILLDNKEGPDWNPTPGDGQWGIAEYNVGSLTLDVEAHGLAADTDYQIKITSPEEATWYPVDATTRVAMASALASGVYDGTTPGTAPPAGFNIYERGYYPSAAPNLATTYDDGDSGVYAFTKNGVTPSTTTTDADGYFSTTKTCDLPSGEYSYIKIAVSDDQSPWTCVLMELSQPMFFTIV